MRLLAFSDVHRDDRQARKLADMAAEARARVEQEHAVGPGSRGRHAPLGVQPAGRPAAAELVLGLAALAAGGEVDRGKQDLLDRALDRA